MHLSVSPSRFSNMPIYRKSLKIKKPVRADQRKGYCPLFNESAGSGGASVKACPSDGPIFFTIYLFEVFDHEVDESPYLGRQIFTRAISYVDGKVR